VQLPRDALTLLEQRALARVAELLLGELARAAAPLPDDGAPAKQISATITSAIWTRSKRPRSSSLRGRGVGGLVASVMNVAAKLRTSSLSMPPA